MLDGSAPESEEGEPREKGIILTLPSDKKKVKALKAELKKNKKTIQEQTDEIQEDAIGEKVFNRLADNYYAVAILEELLEKGTIDSDALREEMEGEDEMFDPASFLKGLAMVYKICHGKEMPRGGVEEEDLDLGDARTAYFKALAERQNEFSRKRKLGRFGFKKKEEEKFQKLKKRYEASIQAEHQVKLEAKKEELIAAASEGGLTKELFDEYVALLEEEESKIDGIATSPERSRFKRFQGFWRRHAKKRLVLGLSVAGVGLGAALIGAGAVGALFGTTGFLIGRGIASGGGSYMAAEAAMDLGTKKLGQRGIIDDETKIGAKRSWNEIVANLPFRKSKGAYESKAEIDRVVQDAENGNNVFEKYTTDQLRTELARLRALSMDKGVEIGKAGRLGAMHAPLIELVQKTYRKKLLEELLAESSTSETSAEGMPDRADIIFGSLTKMADRETTAAQEALVTQTDIDRKKKSRRHALAAIIGLTATISIGTGTVRRISSHVTGQIYNKAGELIEHVRGGEDIQSTEAGVDATNEASSEPADTDSSGNWFSKLKDRVLGTDSTDAAKSAADQTIEAEHGSSTADSLGAKVGKMIGAAARELYDKNAPAPDATADTPTEPQGQEQGPTESGEPLGDQKPVQGPPAPDATVSTPDVTGQEQGPTQSGEPLGGQEPAPDEQGPPAPDATETTATGATPEAEDTPPTRFSDRIDSTEVSGHDSRWRSCRDIFIGNAEELGYTGDLENEADIKAWAETQTANVFHDWSEANGGNVADLVHDGDMVHLDVVDGKAVLSFEDASGIEAGHLPDNNVSEMMEGMEVKDGVEYDFQLDDDTGDEYMSITSGDDTYQVYDWDRDNNPNVIMPDGTHKEMSVNELQEMLQSNDLAEPVTETAADTSSTAAAAEQDSGNFSNDSLQEILQSNDSGHIEEYLSDYVSEHGWAEDKARVFLNSLRNLTDMEIHGDLGHAIDGDPSEMTTTDLDRLMDKFDKFAVKDNWSDLNDVDTNHWTPVKIDDHYHMANRVHFRLRSDPFIFNIGGDMNPNNMVWIGSSQMEDAMRANSLPDLKDLSPVDSSEQAIQELGANDTEGSEATTKETKSDFQEIGGSRSDETEIGQNPDDSNSAQLEDVPVENPQEGTADTSSVSDRADAAFSELDKITNTENGLSGIEASLKDGQLLEYQGLEYTKDDGVFKYRMPGGWFQEVTPENAPVLEQWNEYFREHAQEMAGAQALSDEAKNLLKQITGEPTTENPDTSTPVDEGPAAEAAVETASSPDEAAVGAINVYRKDLDFDMTKLDTADVEYLSVVKKVADEAAQITQEAGKDQLSQALSDLSEKIDSQIENLSTKQAA